MAKDSKIKMAVWASLGVGLEYYDFVIYALMADSLGTLFFAGSDPFVQLLKSLALITMGYLIRPLGGVLFGSMGDVVGRKKTFLFVMMLMAISTFCIGLLPTALQVGNQAAFFLIFFRMLQGLSYGAELPGAITVICEHTHKKEQSFYSSFIFFNNAFGSILASFILYLLNKVMSHEDFLAYGWRIPFLLGGVLAIISYHLRKCLTETEAFNSLKEKQSFPMKHLLANYLPSLVFGIGLIFFISNLVIFTVYLPTYLSSYYHFQQDNIYLATTVSLVWFLLITPFIGKGVDLYGRYKTIKQVIFLFLIGAIPLFFLLSLNTFFSLVMVLMGIQTVIAFLTVSYSPLLVSLFPSEVRYTGVAICYNFSYSLSSLLALALSRPYRPLDFLLYLGASALITLFCTINIENRSFSMT